MEVGSGDEFGELASVGDEIEELPSADVLEDDGKALVSRFILFFVGGVLSHSHKLDQVLVVEVFHDTELMLQHWQTGRLLLVLLNGHQVAVLVFAEFDSELE